MSSNLEREREKAARRSGAGNNAEHCGEVIPGQAIAAPATFLLSSPIVPTLPPGSKGKGGPEPPRVPVFHPSSLRASFTLSMNFWIAPASFFQNSMRTQEWLSSTT